MPVTNSTNLSSPITNPACGTAPYFRVSRYHHNSSTGTFISYMRFQYVQPLFTLAFVDDRADAGEE
jgi:hypothetical protein